MGGKPKSLRPKYPKPAKEGSAEVTVKPPKPVIEVIEDEITDKKNMTASKKRRLRKKIIVQKLQAEGKTLKPKVKTARPIGKKNKPSKKQRMELKTEKATIVAKKIEKATKSSAKIAGATPPKSAEKKKPLKKLLKKAAGDEKMEVEVTKPKGKKKLSKKKNVK